MNQVTKVQLAETLAQAYVAAFAEIEGATKAAAGQVGQQKYKYADLSAVMDAIKPALTKHGLAFWQLCEPSADGVVVETVLVHMSGEERSLGKLFVPANKKDAQGFGSAQTYARRYSLQTAFGVPAEDDDGNAAARGQSQGQGAVSPPQRVSEADLATIKQLCTAVGGGQAGLILKAYQIHDLDELTPSKAKAVIGNLNDKLAAKAKAQTDAMAREEA